MSNNKFKFNNRPGRYNTAGQFVSAGEQTPQQYAPTQQPTHNLEAAPPAPQEVPVPDNAMKSEFNELPDVEMASKHETRPAWMKTKLAGVRKISNRERRRRQNQTLRRLLTPKNALMVINEIMPGEQTFRVEQLPASQPPFSKARQPNQFSFCADLTIDGGTYKGYGDSKMSARNAAAEQAIRDVVIKKLQKLAADGGEPSEGSCDADEEALPMIQVASFALHKLFSEWECEGHKVPSLRPNNNSVCEPEPVAVKARALPAGAAGMHPAMLLTYMRPGLEYRELGVEGDKPQSLIFTMAVDVDGVTYTGKASNKKEARKRAARAACAALFNVTFDDCAPTPLQ